MSQRIKSKVQEIAACLDAALVDSEPLGLQYGELGRALFFFHYARQFADSYYEQQALNILSRVFDKINNSAFQPVLALDRELAEIGCALEYLRHFGIVDLATNEILHEFDLLLYDYMQAHLQKRNYDPNNGALVVGYYYLMRLRSTNSVRPYLEELVDQLAGFAIVDSPDSLHWDSTFSREKRTYLCLSHGQAAIVVFLLALQEHNIKPNYCRELVEKSLKYLSANILDYTVAGHYFPAYVGSVTRTRLGWCYGDLGIAYALFRGGQALDNADYQRLSIDIFTTSAQRRDLASNAVEDAGLTYGSAGIATMYQKMYQLTNTPLFSRTADYWYEQTLNFATHPTQPAGYQAAYNQKRSYNNTSYSEGIAGIGLALLSSLDIKNIHFSEFMYLL